MIKHVVVWKLKESAQGASKADNAARIKRELEALRAKLPFARKIEVGINFNSSPAAYDVVLYSEFASREDLDRYQDAPEHKAVADFIGTVREERVVVDYEG
jgi:Stress responsive A/B Barrel Domain